MHACMYVLYVHTRTYVCMYVRMYCMYIHVHTYVRMYVCMYVLYVGLHQLCWHNFEAEKSIKHNASILGKFLCIVSILPSVHIVIICI